MSLKMILAIGLAAVLGALGRPIVDWVAAEIAGGPAIDCVAGGRLCVGMPVTAAFAPTVENDIGGVLDISCGFVRPGRGAADHLSPLELMQENCSATKFVVGFSNGRRLTNIWVDNGRIVRIDNYARHIIDL